MNNSALCPFVAGAASLRIRIASFLTIGSLFYFAAVPKSLSVGQWPLQPIGLRHRSANRERPCTTTHRIEREQTGVSGPGEFPREESNQAAGSTPGGALPEEPCTVVPCTVLRAERAPRSEHSGFFRVDVAAAAGTAVESTDGRPEGDGPGTTSTGRRRPETTDPALSLSLRHGRELGGLPLDDEPRTSLRRVVFTPAVYPRLIFSSAPPPGDGKGVSQRSTRLGPFHSCRLPAPDVPGASGHASAMSGRVRFGCSMQHRSSGGTRLLGTRSAGTAVKGCLKRARCGEELAGPFRRRRRRRRRLIAEIP